MFHFLTQRISSSSIKRMAMGAGLTLLATALAGCSRLDDAQSMALPSPVPTSTQQTYRPPSTWQTTNPELQRRYNVQEATRVAILTTVPQETIGPDYTPEPYVWPTRVPIPVSVLRPSGMGNILEDGAAALPSEAGSFVNQWQSSTGNEEIRVYAGSDKYDRLQGQVVITSRISGQAASVEVYQTSQKHGSLRVVGAQGQQLILASSDNTIFVFDVSSRMWVVPLPQWIHRSAGTGTIQEDGHSNLPPESGIFKNQWYKQVGAQETRVYAGGETADTSQGILVLVTTTPGQPQTIERYQTSSRKGSLRIVDAFGDTLILTADRQLYLLNLTNRTWETP